MCVCVRVCVCVMVILRSARGAGERTEVPANNEGDPCPQEKDGQFTLLLHSTADRCHSLQVADLERKEKEQVELDREMLKQRIVQDQKVIKSTLPCHTVT